MSKSTLIATLGSENIVSRIQSLESSIGNQIQIDVFSANSELISTLPNNAGLRVVFSQQVDVLAGDTIIGLGQFEVTNDLGYTCGVGRSIIRAASAVATTGTTLRPGRQAMDNVSPERHHIINVAQVVDVVASSGTVYYNMLANAVSGSGSGNLIVEQGYGSLTLVRFRRLG